MQWTTQRNAASNVANSTDSESAANRRHTIKSLQRITDHDYNDIFMLFVERKEGEKRANKSNYVDLHKQK